MFIIHQTAVDPAATLPANGNQGSELVLPSLKKRQRSSAHPWGRQLGPSTREPRLSSVRAIRPWRIYKGVWFHSPTVNLCRVTHLYLCAPVFVCVAVCQLTANCLYRYLQPSLSWWHKHLSCQVQKQLICKPTETMLMCYKRVISYVHAIRSVHQVGGSILTHYFQHFMALFHIRLPHILEFWFVYNKASWAQPFNLTNWFY